MLLGGAASAGATAEPPANPPTPPTPAVGESTLVHAADPAVQSPASLEAAARDAALRHASALDGARVEVRPLDPRLRLPACTRPLVARIAPGTRSPTRLAVEVACPAPNWRRYVGVAIAADAPVVVATRPLAPGQAIEAADLEVVTRPLGAAPGGRFASADQVVGRVASRAIGPGEVIAPAATRRVPVVRRGQEVTVLARSEAFAVRSRGVALGDAGVAERVRVRNVASGRQIEAVVLSGDLVEVAVR